MSNKKNKPRSVERIKKRPPRLDLAHLEKRCASQPSKPTIKHVEVKPPVKKSSDSQRPNTQSIQVSPVTPSSIALPSLPSISTSATDESTSSMSEGAFLAEAGGESPRDTGIMPPVGTGEDVGGGVRTDSTDDASLSSDLSAESQEASETIEIAEVLEASEGLSSVDTPDPHPDTVIQRKLKRLSLAELQRYAKQSAKGADNAILEYEGLSKEYEAKLDEIKAVKTPKNATEEQRAEFNARRTQLRKDRDALARSRTISYENAVALERAADEYAEIVALLLDLPVIDYRRQPRLNERHVDLSDDEKLSLIERFLATGRFTKKESAEPTSDNPRNTISKPQATSKIPETAKPRSTQKTQEVQGTQPEKHSAATKTTQKASGGIPSSHKIDFRGFLKKILLFLPTWFIAWRRRRLDEAASRLPHVKEPAEKKAATQKLPPKEIPPVYVPPKKAGGCRCYGATPEDAQADAASHAEAAGAGDMRRTALKAAIPVVTKKPAVVSQETTPVAQKPSEQIKKASPDEEVSRIKRISHSKLNFLRRWFGDIFGLVLSSLIILLCFLLPLYVVAEVIKGDMTWQDFVQRRTSPAVTATLEEPTRPGPAVSTPEVEASTPAITETPTQTEPVEPEPVQPTEQTIQKTIDYAGHVAQVVSYDGYATVEYPRFVTDDEIAAFCEMESDRYPELLTSVLYGISQPGMLRATYPQGISPEYRSMVLDLLEDDLRAYVTELLIGPVPKPEPELKPKSTGNAGILTAKLRLVGWVSSQEVALKQPIEKVVSYLGYEVRATSYDGHARIEYPSFITNDEVVMFCSLEVERYSSIAKDMSYGITEAGILDVRYPMGISHEDRIFALDRLAEDLLSYVALLTTDVSAEPVLPPEPEPEPKPMSVKTTGPLAAPVYVHRVLPLWQGASVQIDAYDGYAHAIYPASIQSQDIDEAAAMLFAAYPSYLTDVYYEITTPGRLTVTYPTGLSETELQQYIDVLERELRWYLSYLGREPRTTEEQPPVATVLPIVPVEQETPVAKVKKSPVEWTRPIHNLSLFGSPYGFSFVDFYIGRDAIIHAGVPLTEFMSSYGFGAQLDYQWNFNRYLYAGIGTGFYAYHTQRSILSSGTLYMQIPLQAKFGFHYDWKHVGISVGIGGGIDMARLHEQLGGYFMGTVELGVSYRFSRHWSIQWKAVGGVTLQPKPNDPPYSSNTYVTQPAMLGVMYHF